MEIETAARRYLLTVPSVRGYVGTKVYKNTLLVSPEGTGGMALVVRRGAGWAKPDRAQSSEFPRLVVECWADPDRDANGLRISENAQDKAMALFRVVDAALHRKRNVVWGAGGTSPGLLVVSSIREEEPVAWTGVEDIIEGRRVLIGEMAVVPALYELHV